MKIEKKELDEESKDVQLYLPKTTEMIYMTSIASRKLRNVIGPRQLSLRYHA
jgi:hypothetical protein